MTELPRPSNSEAPAPSYWIEVTGDDDRMVAGDICDVIEEHYSVRARMAAPLELRLKIRDAYGATRAYARAWQPMKRLVLTTGTTRIDLEGVSAEAELGPVSDG